MSARKRRSTTSLLATVRRVLDHLLVLPALTFNILFRPAWTGSNTVNNDTEGLLRAIKFYSEMFALAFTISLVANQFQLYEGKSEWRSLIEIVLQLLIAIPIISLLGLALPERIRPLTVIQALLYVVGVYLLIASIVSIPISYLDFTFGIPDKNRELDIFGTEYEKCLSHNSTFYWLIRGDLQFFLYADRWTPQDWANWLFDNFYYVVAIPFFAIFAFMLRPKRKISFILICLIAVAAFVITVAGAEFTKPRLSRIAATGMNTECASSALDQIVKKYAPNLIARQIAYKIKNQSLKDHQSFASLSVLGTDFVLAYKLDPDVEPTLQVIAEGQSTIREYYCSNNMYLVAARRINSNLIVVVNDKDDALLLRQRFSPQDCPAGPTDGASK
jgi:hypothetical protein